MLEDQLRTPVSSSLTRWLVHHGRMTDVARCLGRCFTLSGQVVQGERRGRTLGVPTVNLDATSFVGRAMPGVGVYAGYVTLEDLSEYAAAISIGLKPTFRGQTLAIEAHLLDFHGELYERPITIHFSRWLRDQQRFPGLEALRAQLHRDIEQTRNLHELGLLRGLADDGRRQLRREAEPTSTATNDS